MNKTQIIIFSTSQTLSSCTGRSLDASYDSTWSDIYHKLIHSPALEALLQLECSYSMAMKDVVKKKDDALKELREK